MNYEQFYWYLKGYMVDRHSVDVSRLKVVMDQVNSYEDCYPEKTDVEFPPGIVNDKSVFDSSMLDDPEEFEKFVNNLEVEDDILPVGAPIQAEQEWEESSETELPK